MGVDEGDAFGSVDRLARLISSVPENVACFAITEQHGYEAGGGWGGDKSIVH